MRLFPWYDNSFSPSSPPFHPPFPSLPSHLPSLPFSHSPNTHQDNPQRNRAWATFPYPCVGQFDFLDFPLSTRRMLYPRLLSLLKAGGTLVDVGCCLGHDIRKLVFDGVPGGNLVGVELHQGFIDLGFELFRDREGGDGEGYGDGKGGQRGKGGLRFYQGDLLADGGVWDLLDGGFDVVNLGMLLHCFTWEEQVRVLERCVGLLKTGKGVSIVGITCGTVDGRVEELAGKKVPAHNEETFGRLVKEVAEKTKTEWEVDVECDYGVSVWDGKHTWVGTRMRRVVFELKRLGGC